MPSLVVALDVADPGHALGLVDALGDAVEWYKVGPVLHVADGPAVVRTLRAQGKQVFLDLKWHDIPNTVAGAVAAAARAGAALATVHLAGGAKMLEAAVASRAKLRLLGVGVLTSLGPDDYAGVVGRPVADLGQEQRRLVRLGVAAGLDGYVAAAAEAAAVRVVAGARTLVAVPGVRRSGGGGREGDGVLDQVRVATPSDAVGAGADFVVVGRPITGAPDPRAEALAVLEEMRS